MMKPANSQKQNADRISTLPDRILSQVLSYIPIKNAVATSVLSKRWKSLWKAVHNLDFELDFCPQFCFEKRHNNCSNGWSVDEDMKFSRIVNHVLLLHDGGFLNKFSLVWRPRCIPSQVNSWISTEITRNVHELFLCLENSDVPFEIPSSVFGCATLKSLELDGNMFVSDSVAVCLPMLVTLKILYVHFQSDEAFQKLISGCPLLNFLFVKIDMDRMKGYRNARTNLFTFIVSSTSLRNFTLNVSSYSENFEAMPYCSLVLEAPSLESLGISGFAVRIFVRESLSSLVAASFCIINICEDDLFDASFCNSLVEAIRAFDCAKSFILSRYVSSALSRASTGLSTKFKRLTRLIILADCCCCSSIQDFIQSSDNLEELMVYKKSDCLRYDNYSHTHSNWTTPVEVPRCLSNSLKTVQFGAYSGFDYEREMIGYMLMHGSGLKDMTIKCFLARNDIKIELLQELCAFPRKSQACKVNFIY